MSDLDTLGAKTSKCVCVFTLDHSYHSRFS